MLNEKKNQKKKKFFFQYPKTSQAHNLINHLTLKQLLIILLTEN